MSLVRHIAQWAASPAAGPGRRVGVRRTACSLGARLALLVVLSLSLLLASPGVGTADAPPIPPPEVLTGGVEIATPLEEGTASCFAADAASLGLGTPACVGLALATVAVATAPLWFPLANDALGGLRSILGGGTSATSCTVTMGAESVATGANDQLGATITGATSGCPSSPITNYLYVKNVTCYFPSNGATTQAYATEAYIYQVGQQTGTLSYTAFLCGNGGQLEQGDFQWRKPLGTNPQANSQWVTFSNVGISSNYTTTTTVQCRSLSDQSTFSTSQSYVGTSGWVMPSCDAAAPGTGAVPEHVVVQGGPQGGVQHVLSTWDTRGDYQTKYPSCFGPSGLLCNIHVNVDGSQCAVGDTLCSNWYSLNQTDPSRVNCKFGPYSVAMANCRLLRYAYRANTVQTVNTTDTQGNPITDPSTDGSTSTGTTTGAFPTEGPNPTAPGTIPTSGTNPDGQGCWGSGWSWNPVSWVYVPVKCVFVWAFAPDPATMQSVTTSLDTAWAASTPGQWVSAVGSIQPTGDLSGCEGPPLNLDFYGVHVHSSPFSACSGAMATAASFVRAALSLTAVAGGFFACLRALGSGLGWSPQVGSTA